MTAVLATTLTWLAVLLCGGVGSVLRFLVDGAVGRRSSPGVLWGVPMGTLVVNLTGAFALGLLDGVVLPEHAALIVCTGFIGAYTTFSTWIFETQRLGEERQSTAAMLNLVVSLGAGLAVAALGLWIGGRL